MKNEIIDFIKENYRIEKYKRKVNSNDIKADISLYTGIIKVEFPIMNDKKKESKEFNIKVKEKGDWLICNYFEDLNKLITSKNFKIEMSENIETYKYCFFYKTRNFVFSIHKNEDKYSYIYINKSIEIVRLKIIIIEKLFGIKLNEIFHNPYSNNNTNLSKEEVEILKILLI